MLGILKKNEAGYIRGVMDHLGRDDTEMVFDETGLEKEKAKEKKSHKCSVGRNVPVEQQQQGQHRQIGGGDVGVLLETHKDDDDQCGWDDVVTLQERKRRRKKRRLQ